MNRKASSDGRVWHNVPYCDTVSDTLLYCVLYCGLPRLTPTGKAEKVLRVLWFWPCPMRSGESSAVVAQNQSKFRTVILLILTNLSCSPILVASYRHCTQERLIYLILSLTWSSLFKKGHHLHMIHASGRSFLGCQSCLVVEGCCFYAVAPHDTAGSCKLPGSHAHS